MISFYIKFFDTLTQIQITCIYVLVYDKAQFQTYINQLNRTISLSCTIWMNSKKLKVHIFVLGGAQYNVPTKDISKLCFLDNHNIELLNNLRAAWIYKNRP